MLNSYKDDIKLMLNKLSDIIGNDSENYESLISSIYNDFDALNIIDQCVIREYINDSINAITESKVIENNEKEIQVPIISSNCRVMPGNDGKFYVIDDDKILGSFDNENDAKTACQAEQKNTLVSAPELEEQPVENNQGPQTEQNNQPPVDENIQETPTENNEENTTELNGVKDILEDADNILSVIDNSIKITSDLDTVAKLIIQQDAIATKKQNLEDADPSNPDIKQMVDSFRDFLDQVEVQSIDLTNKNAPGADVNTSNIAEETKEELDNFDKEKEEEKPKEDAIAEDTTFDENEKPITDKDESENISEDELENDESDIDTLHKEGSADAPSAEDIDEKLGDTDDIFEDEDESQENINNNDSFENENEFESIDEAMDNNISVEDIDDIDDMVSELTNIINRNIDNDPEVEDIKDRLDEKLDEIKNKLDFDNIDEINETDEEPKIDFDEESEENNENDEVNTENVEPENENEISDDLDLHDEDIPEEFSDENESHEEEEKTIKEDTVIDENKDPLCMDTLFEEDIPELTEEDLHKVDFPGGLGADKGAIQASEVKKDNLLKKVRADIEKYKNKILKGKLVENLGAKEVRELNKKYDVNFIEGIDHDEKMKINELIDNFDEWTSNLTIDDFKNSKK